jgi:KilA-N domain/Protein of unknown function (DUF3627)
VWIELYKFHFLSRQTGAGATYLIFFSVIIKLSKLPIFFQNKKKMTSELAFQHIKGNYWYAAYGEFKVIMDKTNGYINATKMCTSGGKELCDWIKNKSSQELIQTLESNMVLENTHPTLDISDLPLKGYQSENSRFGSLTIQKVYTAKKTEIDCIISGTYCHPDLIPPIACWISPLFALKVSKIINGYIVNEYKSKLNDMQLHLEETTISVLKHKWDKLMIEEQLKAATLATHLAQQKTYKLETVVQKKELRHQIWSSTHAFTMMRLNNPNAKLPLYALRRKRCDMSGAVKKLRAKHPNSVMIFRRSYVPNPINFYNRLKSCGILCFNGNYCHASVPEGELIDKLEKVYSITE